MAPHDGDFETHTSGVDDAALFEPVALGPVTAPNRFYQPPQWATGSAACAEVEAAMLSMRAEGLWGVVCSAIPLGEADDEVMRGPERPWQEDPSALRRVADAVHAHGALAGAGLVAHEPAQGFNGSRLDDSALRKTLYETAARVAAAGFDVLHLDIARGGSWSPYRNASEDAHKEHACARLRTLVEKTRAATQGRCAIVLRIDAEVAAEGPGSVFSRIADLPDLWEVVPRADVSAADAAADLARIKTAGAPAVFMPMPFGAPKTIAAAIGAGTVDFTGSLHAAIADPFLPRKISENRVSEARPCLGCLSCPAEAPLLQKLTCPQNPTFGMEWKAGWHPERMTTKEADARVLVLGAGPAGLEAARVLGQRGYRVQLAATGTAPLAQAEALTPEAALCADRLRQIRSMPTVDVLSELVDTAAEVRTARADHVVLATGAAWRRESFDGTGFMPVAPDAVPVFTPDDIQAGRLPEGPVMVFDGEGSETASRIALRIRSEGRSVTLVARGDSVAPMLGDSALRSRIRRRLVAQGIDVIPARVLTRYDGKVATLTCVYGGKPRQLPAKGVVMVTARVPDDRLYRAILDDAGGDLAALPFTVTRIGDCDGPGSLAQAVHAAHRFARGVGTVEQPQDAAHPTATAEGSPATAPARRTATTPGPAYRERLVEAWEQAVSNEAARRALAAAETNPEKRAALARVADFDQEIGRHLSYLLKSYGVAARPAEELRQEVSAEDEDSPQDWDALVTQLRAQRYERLDAMRSLQSVAPAEDLAHLALLSKGEAALAEFVDRVIAGRNRPTAPLDTFLRTLIQQRQAA